MNSRPPDDQAFHSWLTQRTTGGSGDPEGRAGLAIAIEAPCVVCQPRVALALADYLNEFDDSDNRSHWLPVTDHRLEQLQAHREFREALDNENANEEAAIRFLSQRGGVILELPNCHAQTHENSSVFQISLSCKEPSGGRHHLWINAKRIPGETLVLMIANAFFDWACHGGDRIESETNDRDHS